jgi:hypothetical protein
MKNNPETEGPFVVGERLLMTVVLAAIAEKHALGSPTRARLEGWARQNIPLLLKQGNSSGDVLGEFQKCITHSEIVLSQHKAERALVNKATGAKSKKQAVEKALAAGDVKRALEEKVFFMLRFEHYRNLQHPDFCKMLEMAVRAGDQKLFIRLGRALSQKPKVQGPERMQMDKLALLLVKFWIRGPQGQLGICRLTDEALTEFCNLFLKRKDLTLATVRKVRQRFGLKKGPKPWFKKVERQKNGSIVMTLE